MIWDGALFVAFMSYVGLFKGLVGTNRERIDFATEWQ